LVDEVQLFLRASGVPISLPQVVPGFESFCFEAPEIFGRHTERITELLCTYFALLGNEHIALLGPDIPHDQILNQQLMAYTRAMSRQQQAVTCCLVAPHASAMDALAKRWVEYRGKLAVISYDDEHALRFMTAMHKIGLLAPRDFRIIGFNSTDAARYSDPPLSSVAQDFDYIADRLITSALALSEGRTEQAIKIPASLLIVRETCGGAAGLNDDIRSRLPGLAFSVEGTSPTS
jgi:DNA-binding LacI/PurR family transcriptional regulator